MSCLVYDEEGDFSNQLVENSPQQYFFRKMSRNQTEIKICKILQHKPIKHCVRVYDVNDNAIDQEFLLCDNNLNRNHPYEVHLAIESAFKELHKLNIVYVDIRIDNIGFSEMDNCFKIFDFDLSGIVDPSDDTKWLHQPCEGYIYNKYKAINKMMHDSKNKHSLYRIDDILLNCWV